MDHVGVWLGAGCWGPSAGYGVQKWKTCGFIQRKGGRWGGAWGHRGVLSFVGGDNWRPLGSLGCPVGNSGDPSDILGVAMGHVMKAIFNNR